MSVNITPPHPTSEWGRDRWLNPGYSAIAIEYIIREAAAVTPPAEVVTDSLAFRLLLGRDGLSFRIRVSYIYIYRSARRRGHYAGHQSQRRPSIVPAADWGLYYHRTMPVAEPRPQNGFSQGVVTPLIKIDGAGTRRSVFQTTLSPCSSRNDFKTLFLISRRS